MRATKRSFRPGSRGPGWKVEWPLANGPDPSPRATNFPTMKIPKTLSLKCLCGSEQTLALTFDAYESVPPDGRHLDFVYCDRCQMPIAFELPTGLAKRQRDRYSTITIAQPLRMAS